MNGSMALSSPGWVLVVRKGLCFKKAPGPVGLGRGLKHSKCQL